MQNTILQYNVSATFQSILQYSRHKLQSTSTWTYHSFSNGHWIFLGPLLNLFIHFSNFSWIHCPQAALALASITRWLLYLLKTFIQTQIMPHRVFPAIWSCLEVREVFTTNNHISTLWIQYPHMNVTRSLLQTGSYRHSKCTEQWITGLVKKQLEKNMERT